MSILIADSGSTKTDWCLIEKNKKPRHYYTQGINPFFRTEEECLDILSFELKINLKKETISKIVFYGAGVKDASRQTFIKKVMRQYFRVKVVEAHSDMLAAARSTVGDEKGIVCILGTGSNSCFYNGTKIVKQNPSLGYIVGDEGSGVYLGKRVLQYFFYKTFDEELHDAFLLKYGDNLQEILGNIYGASHANRYLASFTQFLIEHKDHYMVQNIVEDAFIDFHHRHVLKYREAWKYPVHFAGTVAMEFKHIIESLHHQYGLSTGKIIKSPITSLITYHKNRL